MESGPGPAWDRLLVDSHNVFEEYLPAAVTRLVMEEPSLARLEVAVCDFLMGKYQPAARARTTAWAAFPLLALRAGIKAQLQNRAGIGPIPRCKCDKPLVLCHSQELGSRSVSRRREPRVFCGKPDASAFGSTRKISCDKALACRSPVQITDRLYPTIPRLTASRRRLCKCATGVIAPPSLSACR
jgi:hypothetical protein